MAFRLVHPPAPCWAAVDPLSLGADLSGGVSGQSLPTFVRAEYRPLILDAATR